MSRPAVPLPSDRSFGLTFVFVLGALAGWLWWREHGGAWMAGLGAALLLAVSLAYPRILHPFNRAWMAFGAVLQRIVSPVVLGVMFFGVITPLGWALRVGGRDEMRRRFEPDAPSYWIDRDPPGPAPGSLNQQF